jgi:hypothetical protein
MFRLMKLQPPHGWNAVGWELAIVTLGVLIALGAQQMVEGWSWDRKVAAAEETMREEIRSSLLSIVELDQLKSCTAAQLDRLQDALMEGDRPRLASSLMHARCSGSAVFGLISLPGDTRRTGQRPSRRQEAQELFADLSVDPRYAGSPSDLRSAVAGTLFAFRSSEPANFSRAKVCSVA